jgi:hypothetical protein
MKLIESYFIFRLTDVALRLFTLYSEGSLILENEPEIKQKMKESLSFNFAKQDIELNFNLTFKGDDSARPKAKEKALSEPNVKNSSLQNLSNSKRNTIYWKTYLISQCTD